MVKRIATKIRYKYLWHARQRLRYYRLAVTRRILWTLFADKAVYKPYKDLRGNGSGWAGRWIWRGRVIAYVDKHDSKRI